MPVQAVVQVGKHDGLQVICALRAIQTAASQRGLMLGPCSIESLLPTLMAWHRLHPIEAQQSSVYLLDSLASASFGDLTVGLTWRSLNLEGEWSSLLLQTPSGTASWQDLEARLSLRQGPRPPSVWLGRQAEADLLKRRFEGRPIVVLEGQPLIGRTTFARAFASRAFHDWVEGAEYFDLDDPEVSHAFIAQAPEELWTSMRGQHKLFILDNASRAAHWLSPLVQLLSTERSLCSLLIIPVENCLESGLPWITLGPLQQDAFESLWTLHFGESPQDHLDRMNERTGRVPGVVTALHRQLGRRQPKEIEAAFDHNYSQQKPLLQKLAARAGQLSERASRRLRILSLASAQISLRLALEPLGEDTASLHEVGELLTSGWMTVEEEGYRIPRPYAMAARLEFRPDSEDFLHACHAFAASARSLSDLQGDLMPLENSRAFLHLLWTSWEAMSWLVLQEEHLDLALEAAVLFWLPALKHGYSKEFLSATHLVAQRLQRLPPNRLTPVFWEGRGRHLRAQGRLKESLDCFELGIQQAQELGLKREGLWNLHFKAATLSLIGDQQEADRLFADLMRQWREAGGKRELAHGLCALALHLFRHGRIGDLAPLLLEATTLAMTARAKDVLVVLKELQGWLCLLDRNLPRAEDFFDEADILGQSMSDFRRDQVGLGRALTHWRAGRHQEALAQMTAMASDSDKLERIPHLLLHLHLAIMNLHFGNRETGLNQARMTYQMMTQMQVKSMMGDVLDLAAFASWGSGHDSSAAVLAGCASEWHQRIGGDLSFLGEEVSSWKADCRSRLGAESFQARYEAGATLDPFRLLELCRVDCSLISQLLPDLVGGRTVKKPPISERQMEVLRLLSQGMSNRQIAEALFVEEGTVKRHIHNLCTELGAQGRVRLVKKALDLGLLP